MKKNSPPMICLCATAPTIEENVRRVRVYGRIVDCVELRLDCLGPGAWVAAASFPRSVNCLTLCSFRRVGDGGHCDIDEARRLSVLAAAAGGGFDYIDIEEDVPDEWIRSLAHSVSGRIIRSRHDFRGVPPDVDELLLRLSGKGLYIPKLAVFPRSESETFALIRAAERFDGEKIVIGMGEWGFPTRVLAGKMGCLLTFTSASVEGGIQAAPGHVDPKILDEVYDFRKIDTDTGLFCVIGNPVMHSRSPWIHNPGLRRIGMNAIYIPIQVQDVTAFLAQARDLSIRGISVTVPHKQAVIPHLYDCDEAVRKIGACNTVVESPQGWLGYNTDVQGFIEPLRRIYGAEKLAHAKATVLGAGGAAISAVYALSEAGVEITIINRTVEKARMLAEKFNCRWGGLDSLTDADCPDIIVNTTVAGMHPIEDEDPIRDYQFKGTEFVYDLIYNPGETVLLRRARLAGCRTLNGADMLLEQAYQQFKIFTGRDFPMKGEKLWSE